MILLGVAACSPISQPDAILVNTNSPSENSDLKPPMPINPGSNSPLYQRTLTVTPFPIITATLAITFPQNSTPIPTLTTLERDSYIKTLLRPNSNCEPPCWWGLTPGKTSWRETQELFQYLGTSVYQITKYSYGVRDTSDPLLISINIEQRDSFLENIFITSDQYLFSEPVDFTTLWGAYSPQNILMAYGLPTQILLRSDPLKRGDHHPYNLWILYGNRGFLIFYSGITQYGTTIHICPRLEENKSIQGIKIFLQSPDNTFPLERMGEWLYSDTYLNGVLPIDQATDLSVQTFYELFTNESQSACFDTPANIWKLRTGSP